MKYEPHAYQQYAIDYIKTHPVAAVFLDCGLGKTSIALTAIRDLLQAGEVHRVLIVAPIRVAKVSWPDEIRKWDHLAGLRFAVAVGTQAERLAALKQDAEVTIINRENLQWLVNGSGQPFRYDMCVLDELSSFKNIQSQRVKAFLRVRPKLKRVVGLTGTPSSNGLMDLFAEFRCLDMGRRLGRFITGYRATFFRPDRYNGNVVYSYKPLPGAEETIYQLISDITISMRSTDHLRMPELVSSEYSVALDEAEREKYETLKRNLILPLTEGGEVTAANAASLSGKLMQMAGGAVYDDSGEVIPIHDRKLDALEDIIEAANGRPVLVAYWFKHDLERIRQRLSRLKIQHEQITTPASIERWNRGESPVGLIHPASAGHGLNLQQGGSLLVWFSLTWSLELYTQTVDRLYRQGQRSETVSVIHILARDTIDERVMKALTEKDSTQSALIDAVKAEIRRDI